MKTKLRKTYNNVIKVTVVILTVFFLYDQLIIDKDLSSITDVFTNFDSSFLNLIFISIAVLLIPANILLESFKWQYLISKLEYVNIGNSVKAVLTGITVSMIMPNRIGDYLGRVFILKKADRLQAVLSTILGSLSQLITTIIFGLIAIIFSYPEYIDIKGNINTWLYIGTIFLIIAIIAISVFAYLNFSVVAEILKKISGRYADKIDKYASVFSWYDSHELLKVLLISMLRYIVFSLQFFLLLRFFDVPVSYPISMMLVAVVYIFITLIPTIALTEIGVRGSVSLFVFRHHFELLGLWNQEMAVMVVSASTILWLFNIILPAIAGTFFIFNLKFFRKTNGN